MRANDPKGEWKYDGNEFVDDIKKQLTNFHDCKETKRMKKGFKEPKRMKKGFKKPKE